MSLLSLYFIITFVVILISRWYYKRYVYIKHLERFPGPPPLPIVGNALEFASPKDLLPKFLKYREEYGDIVKLWIGPSPSLLVIHDYKFLEYLLSSTTILDKSGEYKFLLNWLGTGLLLSDGDGKWKKHRKMITPTFHFKILEQFIGVFESASNVLAEKLKKQVGKPLVDVFPFITLCTLDTICETAMGTSVNAQENWNSEYVRSVKAMCRIIIDRSFNPFLGNNFLYRFTSQYRTEKKAIKVLHDYTNSVIANRKKELEADPNRDDSNEEFEGKRKMALLDLLLKGRSNGEMNLMTDEDIREEVDTFMFAGHDTTAAALSFSLHCLSLYPKVQKRVVEELRGIFHNDWNRAATFNDFQEMKYLEAVIKEVLRLYPPVPFYGRNVHEDIEYDGGILPKGLTLTINAFGMHRSPDLFPNPLEFIPERFIGYGAAGRYPYGYIPFSAGPRNCIGQKFAMLEMKSVLSTILRRFKVLPTIPPHEPEITAETVLKSENGICVRLLNRQN